MGEIKSSIEMAMEKTRNLIFSPAEKEKLHQEEILNRARGIVTRYQEGNLSLRNLEDELKNSPEEEKDFFSQQVVKEMVRNIQIAQDNQRILEAIPIVSKGKADPGILGKISSLANEHQKVLKEGIHSIESLLRERLASLGIQGDAVVPNIEESPEWQELNRETRNTYASELNRLKEMILNLLHHAKVGPLD